MSPTVTDETRRLLALNLTSHPARRNRRRSRHHGFAAATLIVAAGLLAAMVLTARL